MSRKYPGVMHYYDAIAAGYEELHREEQERKLAVIRQKLPFTITPDTTLLDIGCGSGISMEGWHCAVYGIDPSKRLLAQAQEKGFHVREGRAESIPYTGPFTICTALTSLHHAQPEAAAAELTRVCTRWLIISYLKKAPREARLLRALEPFRKVQELETQHDHIMILRKT